MKKRIGLSVLSVSLAVLVVYASARLARSQEGEKPLQPEPDVKALIESLGAPDYAAREAAEKQLLALGQGAVPALEEAMKSHPDTHVRFEAVRILHRISHSGEEKPLGPEPVDRVGQGLEKQVREMLKRLTEQGFLGAEELERLSQALAGGLGEAEAGVARSFSKSDGERKVQFDQGADGHVKVAITKAGATDVYEAGSLDEFKAKFPEIFREIEPLLGSVRVEVFGDPFGGFFGGRRPLGRGPDWPLGPDFGPPPPGHRSPPAGAPGGFRLGVWVGEMTEALRHHLKLGADEGVLVEEVVPGSLAGRMGLVRLDIIVKVNGRSVGSAEDIRAALSGVADGSPVEAEVIREGAPLKLMSAK